MKEKTEFINDLLNGFHKREFDAHVAMTRSGRLPIVRVDFSHLLRGLVDPVSILFLLGNMFEQLVNQNQGLTGFLTEEAGLAYREPFIIVTDIVVPERQRARQCVYVRPSEILEILDCSTFEEDLRSLFVDRLPIAFLNPYQSIRAVRSRMFVGRSADTEDLLDLSPNFQNYVVVGPRRGGKSSLARHVRRESFSRKHLGFTLLGGTHLQREVVSVPYIDVEKLDDLENLWGAILFQMGLRQRDLSGGARKKFSRALFGDIVEKTDFELLCEILGAKGRRAIILLDEVDSWLKKDEQNGWNVFGKLRTLVDTHDSRIKIILLGYEDLYRLSHSNTFPLAGRWHEKRLANLEPIDVADLIGVPMAELGIQLEQPAQISSRIDKATGGMPNLVQDVCSGLVIKLSETGKRKLSPRDVHSFLENEGQDIINKVYLTFSDIGKSLPRMIAYVVASDSQTSTVLGLLAHLNKNHNLSLSDSAVRHALDYLYLHNVFQIRGKKKVYGFASQLLEKRLQEDIRDSDSDALWNSLVRLIKQDFQ